MTNPSRTFPQGLTLAPNEVRVPPDTMSVETIWVPGADEQVGKFKHWMRFLLDRDHGPVTAETFAALPVKIQRCIADYRGMLAKLVGGHGQNVAFTLQGPVGKNGSMMDVDVLASKPENGVVLWSGESGKAIDRETAEGAVPTDTELTALANAFFAKGQPQDLLKASYANTPTVSATPVRTEQPVTAESLTRQLGNADLRTQDGKERVMQDRIDAAMLSFDAFRDRLLPKIATMPQDTQARSALARTLQVPFHIVDANVTNPIRNGETAARIAKEMGIPVEALIFSMRHPHHVCFEDLPVPDQFITGFAPTRRSMILSNKLDPTDPMYPYIQFHEFIHVYQHAGHRQRMGTDAYLQLFSQQDNAVFLSDEVQAYGYEIEAINLELNGALKAAALSGKPIDHQDMRKRLGIGDRHAIGIQFLCHLAERYYQGNKEDGRYPDAYVQSVLACIVHDKQAPYQLDQSGRPQRIG